MYNRESSPVVIDSAFTGNHTENLNINLSPGSESLVTSGQGGAIYSILSSLALVNCAFTDNTSRFGGAVFNATSVASVTGCSFNANTALIYGGGMFNFESSPVFVDTTVCANVPDQVRGDWTDFGGNLVTAFCVCPADFNRDGTVDGVDLTELLSAWGTDDLVPDMNGDGVVDGFDLKIILASWGPCP